MQARHVVSAYIFDDIAAALGYPAVRLRYLHAYNKVARAAVLPLQRTANARCERTANSGAFRQGSVQREELPLHSKGRPQGSQRNSRLHNQRQVCRVMLHDLIHIRYVYDRIEPFQAVAKTQLCATSAR